MKASARTTTSIPGPTSPARSCSTRKSTIPTAKRFLKVMARSDHRDREPQHQRAECAEELRDGCRRLYRPVFDPERQRAADRLPAVGGRRRYPAQSPRSQGRQDRGRPLSAQHDERQGTGDARFRSRADVPAALLARDHAAGTASSCASRWSSTSPISTARRIICASRSCSTSRSGARRSRARGSCRKRSAAAASTTKARVTTSASTAC